MTNAKKTADEAREIASTMIKQLSGTMGRLVAMTGAKNFAFNAKDNGDVELSFKIGRNSAGINHVTITLNGLDLYDVRFYSVRKYKPTLKAETEGAYSDMLRPVFESATGMFLSL